VVKGVSRTVADKLLGFMQPSYVGADGFKLVYSAPESFAEPKDLSPLLDQPGYPWHTVRHEAGELLTVTKVMPADVEYIELQYNIAAKVRCITIASMPANVCCTVDDGLHN